MHTPEMPTFEMPASEMSASGMPASRMPVPGPAPRAPAIPRQGSGWHVPARRLGGMALPVAAALLLLPAPARAWFVGGIGFGVPIVVAPPPVFYPPPYPYAPAYPPYAPPPYSPGPYAPGPYASAPYPGTYPPPPLVNGAGPGATAESVRGMSCSTGAYLCPLPGPGRVGARCSCPAQSGGRAYGTIR